jgi:G:T/U-mismatch repair DNA glycosylase
MEPIRLTIDTARLATIIDLPQTIRGQEVDVIVLPSGSNAVKEKREVPKVESVLGILKQYANPAFRDLEKSVWEHAAKEKYLEKNER